MPHISPARLTRFSVLSLFTLLCSAQEFRATLSGQITDKQGGAVATAKITVVDQDSQARTDTVSGTDGFYDIPFLAPATYTITVERPGFKRYSRAGVRLSANDRTTVDAVLETGAVNEQITVSAEASALESATASTGEALGSRQVSELPLSGRSALIVSQVAYGVVPTGNIQFVRPYDAGGPSG